MSDKQKTPKEKWKPEIISPGEAWMGHVEKHHNAGAATPSYLKEKSQAIQEIEKAADTYKKDLQNFVPEPGKEKDVNRDQTKQQDKLKDREKDNDIKISR